MDTRINPGSLVPETSLLITNCICILNGVSFSHTIYSPKHLKQCLTHTRGKIVSCYFC